MKKFLTALLALMLALAMAFTMVACTDNGDVNGGDNGGNNGGNTEQVGGNTDDDKDDDDKDDGDNTDGDNTDGGNTEDEVLKPVDTKVFVQTILEQISGAEGFSVTLTAKADGTVTAPNEAGESANTTIKESVSDTYTLDTLYASNILGVFEDIYNLFAKIGGIEDFFAGTVEPLKDNSGYEYTITVTEADIRPTVEAVQKFFTKGTDDESSEETPSAAEKYTLGELFDLIMPDTAPNGFNPNPESSDDEATQIAKAWVSKFFDADITVGGMYNIVNEILMKTDAGDYGTAKDIANTVVKIVTGSVLGLPLDLDAIAPFLNVIKVDEEGNIGFGEEAVGTPLAEIKIAPIVDNFLAEHPIEIFPGYELVLTYVQIGGMIVENFWITPISGLYGLANTFGGLGLPSFADISEFITSAKVDEATSLSISIKTDKDMKLVSFSAEAEVKCSTSLTIKDEEGKPTDKVLNYAADITASASGTFGYEAVSAGTNGDAGSEAIAA